MRPLTKSLVLSQQHLDYEEHTFAIVNALVFAKVLLVGEELHLGRRFQNRPLIYPVLYKCLVFSVVLIFFHAIESIAAGMWHGNTLAASIPPILGWNPKGLLAVGFSCFVLLIPFFGFREMAGTRPHGDTESALWKEMRTRVNECYAPFATVIILNLKFVAYVGNQSASLGVQTVRSENTSFSGGTDNISNLESR